MTTTTNRSLWRYFSSEIKFSQLKLRMILLILLTFSTGLSEMSINFQSNRIGYMFYWIPPYIRCIDRVINDSQLKRNIQYIYYKIWKICTYKFVVCKCRLCNICNKNLSYCTTFTLVRMLFFFITNILPSFSLSSFDVESLPLRAEKIVQVVVAEEIVNVLNAHPCHPQNIFGW